ncbi:hypothetical protein [Burkholderia phage BCSR129]|nr:hypothetical protein [Burkholderia phage BCSR129]
MSAKTIQKEYGQYGALSKDKKLELVGGWIDGAVVYYKVNAADPWQVMDPVSWVSAYYYMLEYQLPTVSWDCVATNWNWLAVDASGTAKLYANQPVYLTSNGIWQDQNSAFAPISAQYFASYDRGNSQPADSLYSRA